MKLWLDDERVPPEGWVWAKSSLDAAYKLGREMGTNGVHALSFEAISLDHDLGGDDTSMNTVILMEDWDIWPDTVYIHSKNPVGRARLLSAVNASAPPWVSIVLVDIGPKGELPNM